MKIKRWLSLGHLRANKGEASHKKPGEGQWRESGMRWCGRAGGQQRKLQGTGKGGEICTSPAAPQEAKRINEMIS